MRVSWQLNGRAQALARWAARRSGFRLVRQDFYSPLVEPESLPAALWQSAAPTPGFSLELDAQLAFLQRQLSEPLAEFRPAVHAPGRGGFYLQNPMYGPLDAHVLYAIIRRFGPRRVLELGSGFSTAVIAEALAHNAREGRPAHHQVIDPLPSPRLAQIPRPPQVEARSAATVEDGVFAALGDADVLFVDTSHVVKPGGEVVRLVLEVLPALAPGVIVHFHDIFCPFPYPRVLYDRFDVHWQEQYLLQAFLSFNPLFAVLCANHALWRLRREAVTGLVPTLREGMEPSGFWFRRRSG